MVFSSHIFLFYFLPLTLGIYYLSPPRGRHALLALLSYVFYGWANPYFVVVMFTSTLIDYGCGLAIGHSAAASWREPPAYLPRDQRRTRRQHIALIISVCSNLSLLAFFKYYNFGVENYNGLMDTLGLGHLQWDTFFRVTLPLGISFYTFQSMSYTIDVYRGDAKPVRSFSDFACYVSMFPQLVAGPIIRFHEVALQLESRSHTVEKFARGASFIACGLAKKVLLANACGEAADICFGAGTLHVMDAWFGMFAYAFQIYFDFSGYSDMAIGLGLLFGFVFPKNFDSPYRSRSISEFWRRWHLSLSYFLRDYLYVALGGNREGKLRTYVNLALVMLLGGLWHGAAWNFVIWGAIHGAMLGFERMQGKRSIYHRLPAPVGIAITFVITSFAWVFFRAPDLPSSLRYFECLFGIASVQDGAGLLGGVLYQPYYVLLMAVAVGVTWGAPQSWDLTRTITLPRAIWFLALLVMSIAALVTQSFNPFIYFIF